MPGLSVGTVAADFVLTGTDGQAYALRDALARGPLLVMFFKVACPTCQFTSPFIERLYQTARMAGGQVWGISQDSPEDSRLFGSKYGLSFPVLIDEKPYHLSRQYGLKFVPSIFVVAPDGRIQVAIDGFVKAGLEEAHRLMAHDNASGTQPLFQVGERVPEYKPG